MNEYPTRETGLSVLQKGWGWLVFFGILLMLLGFWAAGYSVFVSVIAVIWFGVALVVSGIFQIGFQFFGANRHDRCYQILFGILSLIVGFWIIFQPMQAAVTLTWIVGIFLAVIGVIQVIYSLGMHKEQWGWMLFYGIVDLLLAAMIWAHWPASGLWVIGLFVSIKVILVGWMLMMTGIAARQSKKVVAQ